MLKLEKMLAITIGLIMVFATVACGGEVKVSENASSDIAQSSEQSLAETVTIKVPEGIKNYECLIASDNPQDWDPKIDGPSPLEITSPVPGYVDAISDLKGNYQVTIKLMNPAKPIIQEMTAAIMAGDEYCDVASLPFSEFVSLVRQELLLPLDDIVDVKSNIWFEFSKEMGKINGKQYGLHDQMWIDGILFFNKSLLQREGITEDIYDLVRKGEWTWDKFLEIAKKCHKVNSDGTVQQYGLIDAKGDGLADFLASNGAGIINRFDNKYMYSFNKPEAIAAAQFFQDLILKEKIYKPGMDDDGREAFIRGEAAFCIGIGRRIIKISENMKDEFGLLPMPKGPDAKDYVPAYSNAYLYGIPITNKTPEKTAFVISKLAKTYNESGFWKSVYLPMTRDDESMEMMDLLLSKTPIINYDFIPKVRFGDVIMPIITGEKTPKVAADENITRIQAVLDDYFSQK